MAAIQNGVLQLSFDTMHYIRFGSGSKTLVMLPGLGDGLTTVKGTALPMALMYRAFARDYTVYMFSRRNNLPPQYTTHDMARDLKEAMEALAIQTADLLGVSMGGMIAQHFAADYPAMVNKLVLVVTCPEPNAILTESVQEWIRLARQGRHSAFMESNLRRMYSDAYYRKNRWMIPLLGRLTRPKNYERFFIQAEACLTHNAINKLAQITAPTLVIGGEQDHALGAEPSRMIAASIPGALLKMYSEWGHGLYEEAKDFNQLVLHFLRKGSSRSNSR